MITWFVLQNVLLMDFCMLAAVCDCRTPYRVAPLLRHQSSVRVVLPACTQFTTIAFRGLRDRLITTWPGAGIQLRNPSPRLPLPATSVSTWTLAEARDRVVCLVCRHIVSQLLAGHSSVTLTTFLSLRGRPFLITSWSIVRAVCRCRGLVRRFLRGFRWQYSRHRTDGLDRLLRCTRSSSRLAIQRQKHSRLVRCMPSTVRRWLRLQTMAPANHSIRRLWPRLPSRLLLLQTMVLANLSIRRSSRSPHSTCLSSRMPRSFHHRPQVSSLRLVNPHISTGLFRPVSQ